jgi:hypothetical protein
MAGAQKHPEAGFGDRVPTTHGFPARRVRHKYFISEHMSILCSTPLLYRAVELQCRWQQIRSRWANESSRAFGVNGTSIRLGG